MAYSEKEKDEVLESIFASMREGNSLRFALKEYKLSSSTFYIWIDADEIKSKQYARACEDRADFLVDEMLNIVDEKNDDAQRSRLQYDARKWLVSKLNPKKYGDRVDLTTNGKDILPNIVIESE